MFVYKKEHRIVEIELVSQCEKIQDFASKVIQIDLRGALAQVSKNPIYRSAEESGCHSSCPVPVAVIKAAEVGLEIALPRNAVLEFDQD